MSERRGKQQAFCEAYVRLANVSAAAREAGYAESSAHTRGHELMQRDDIKAEIARLREIRDKEIGMSAADVLRELVEVVTTDLGDVLTWGEEEVLGENGLPMTLPDGSPIMRPVITPIHSSDIPRAKRRAIKSISMSEKGTFKIELADRMKALELLGKHFGIFEKDNAQAGAAAANSIAALVAAAQGKPLTPSTDLPQAQEGPMFNEYRATVLIYRGASFVKSIHIDATGQTKVTTGEDYWLPDHISSSISQLAVEIAGAKQTEGGWPWRSQQAPFPVDAPSAGIKGTDPVSYFGNPADRPVWHAHRPPDRAQRGHRNGQRLPGPLCILPRPRLWLFEVKALGNYPDSDQSALHDDLRALGFAVAVVRSTAEVDAAIADWSALLRTGTSESNEELTLRDQIRGGSGMKREPTEEDTLASLARVSRGEVWNHTLQPDTGRPIWEIAGRVIQATQEAAE